MNLQDQRNIDDWIAAKKLLADELQLDEYLQGMVETYMRDDVPEGARKHWARQVIEASGDRSSPRGWIRAIIENGTVESALRASGYARKRQERRDDGFGARKDEARAALRRAYSASNGNVTSGTRKLDESGGMPWAVLLEEDPSLGAILKSRINKIQDEDSWDEHGYRMVPPVTYSLITEAANQIANEIEGQMSDARAQGMGDLRKNAPSTPTSIGGASVSTI